MRDYLNELHESGNKRKADDPVWAAREAMKPKLRKRFYKQVTVSEAEEGFEVHLDGRPLKTPGKKVLKLPGAEVAELVRGEWDAQETEINPVTMPYTRLVNTAVDGVSVDPQAVMEDILKYAGTDMLCYRQEYPEELVERQKELWDPVLDWVEERLHQSFETTSGIAHVTQPRQAIGALGQAMKPWGDPFQVTCLHTLCSLSGSALTAFALAEGEINVERAWEISNVEEDWNISQWGEDEEAVTVQKSRYESFAAAAHLLKLLTD